MLIEDQQANCFARQLTMPEEEFCRLVDGGTTLVADIATHFKISALMVRVRAAELGYEKHGITKSQLRRNGITPAGKAND